MFLVQKMVTPLIYDFSLNFTIFFYDFPHDNLLFVMKLKLTKERLRYKTTGLNNLIFMKFAIKGGGRGVVGSGQPKCFLRILCLDWSNGMWTQIFKLIVFIGGNFYLQLWGISNILDLSTCAIAKQLKFFTRIENTSLHL